MARRTPEQLAALAKEKVRATRNHDRYVQRTYGLAPGEYARMLATQDNRCAMCRRRPQRKRLAVDHDHATGNVRGLLCYTCNHLVLGMLEFDYVAAYHASVYIGLIADDLEAQQVQVREPETPREHDDLLPF